MMKIRFYLIFSLLIIILLNSCATTSENKSEAVTSSSYNQKKQKSKKLLFEDWKYKGFGKELPVWFEAAFKGDIEEIKKKVQDLYDNEIIILSAQGINSDQADKGLAKKIAELSSDYILYDMSWALLNETIVAEENFEYPYFAAAVFYK